jgi:hypothetical protein
MAFTCPFLQLPAKTKAEHLIELDRYKSTGRMYFHAADTLDYFDFFLNKGTSHQPTPLDTITDLEIGNCNWKVDGKRFHWPMVRTDCVLAANAVANRAKTIPVPTDLDGLQDALKHYQNVPTNLKNEALLFALSMLSGNGIVAKNGPSFGNNGVCPFPEIGTAHFFGAYYGAAA